MNKSQARQWALRHLQNLMEMHWHNGKDPLCYDDAFGSDEGRRLSPADNDKVCDAMLQVLKSVAPRENRRRPIPTGKPGSRWKGYTEWLRKAGYGI